MDLDYLTRLESGCQPDGALATYTYRYLDGPDKGEIGLYQVELRGDDALELIRMAKAHLAEQALYADEAEAARAARVKAGREALDEYEAEHGVITVEEMRNAAPDR